MNACKKTRIQRFMQYSLWIVCLSAGLAWASTETLTQAEPASTQILIMNEHKRLEASIGAASMNRLAVLNDRIVNIFGEDGAFLSQSDEHTGQVFIKPSPDNGSKPLYITLITEHGSTQDLTLVPTQKGSSTVLLKLASHTPLKSPAENLLPGFSRSESVQEQWIQTLKQAVLGELTPLEGRGHIDNRKVSGFRLHDEQSYQSGSFLVEVLRLKNTSKSEQLLEEKTFFKPGDLALSLQTRFLEPDQETLLYVLRKES